MVTLKDVAKLAGVHPTVVSRVMNNDSGLSIRDETRRRIQDAITELNYRPNTAARNLKKKETKMIGMVIPDFMNPVYANIIHGAEDQAAREGYSLLVYSMKQEGLEKNYFSHLLEGRIDGLLITNSELDNTEILKLKETNKPFVLVNRLIKGIDNYVVLDDEHSGRMGVEYLSKIGHRRIAHISGPLFTGTGLSRFQGYREGLEEADIPFRSDYVQESGYTIDGGYSSMKKLIALPEPPTAVFAANVMICLGAINAVYDAGYSIPEDFSIMGIHDVFFASSLYPPLTTIQMPLHEMGVQSVQKLIASIKSPGPESNGGLIIEGASLVVRGSTAEI